MGHPVVSIVRWTTNNFMSNTMWMVQHDKGDQGSTWVPFQHQFHFLHDHNKSQFLPRNGIHGISSGHRTNKAPTNPNISKKYLIQTLCFCFYRK